MRDIKKLASNVSKVAGSALLVGATLAGAAGMAAAQSGSSGDLGDYPSPFVDEDGEVDTQIVVGENAKTSDVVGAIDIAGSLGNAAFETQSVSVEGSGGSWSATDGVTLDTRNDDLYFGQNISEVRETLTDGDLDVLADTTFRDDQGTTYDVTHNLNVGNLEVEHDNNADELDNEDPALHLELPSESSVDNSTTGYVLNLQATVDSIDVEDSDVAGEEIELFGKEYTIASDHSDDGNSDRSYLKLYGSQDTRSVQTGESTTITVDDGEHTIEVVSTDASNNQASLRVDGNLRQENVDDTFNLGGQEVRVEEIVNVGANDDGDGIVEFAIGSEELKVYSGDQIEDSEDDDYEGTYAIINNNESWDTSSEVSTIDFYVGAEDDDEDALTAGETFSHSLFENVEVQFGGLNPDAQEGGDDVEELTVSTSSDDTATVGMETRGGETVDLEFVHTSDPDTAAQFADNTLADSDGDAIEVVEGQGVNEDEYFTADAGDFAHVWEVTNIDRDTTNGAGSGDEAEVDLKDAVTGNTVTADLDWKGSNYQGSEVIDGQKYHFNTSDTSGASVTVTWGDGASAGDAGDETTLYAAQDTASGSAVAMTEQVTLSNSTVELPSTESTDAASVTVEADDTNVYVSGETNVNANATSDGSVIGVTVNGGQTYELIHDGADSVKVQPELQPNPSAALIQPEDDNDAENAYVVTPGVDTNDDEMGVADEGNIAYSGGTYSDMTTQLESNDDVETSYNVYGSYTWADTDDQGDFVLNVPFGQSTVGAAVTAMDGSLSAEGGAGAVDSQSPTGWPSAAMLDSEVESSHRQNSNMILVGGPAVNDLVGDLADEDKTWSGDQYEQGTALVHLVEDAFSEGNDALVVAGKSKEDTREAASYISNYADHAEDLAGETQKTLTTAQGSQ